MESVFEKANIPGQKVGQTVAKNVFEESDSLGGTLSDLFANTRALYVHRTASVFRLTAPSTTHCPPPPPPS